MSRKERRELARRQAGEASRLRLRGAHAAKAGEAAALARRLLDLGSIEAAREALAAARRQFPGEPALDGLYAYALAATGRVAEAVRLYREMLAARPDEVAIIGNLAFLLLKSGALDEAGELLERAAGIAPEHANTAYLLGELRSSQRRSEEAFAAYRRAVPLLYRHIGEHPGIEHCNDLVKLAWAQLGIGDAPGALESFDRALALRPDHAFALARRGLALVRLRRSREAIDSLKRAAALEPGFAEARRAIGELLLAGGDARGAQPYFSAAAKISPGDELARFFLAAAQGSAAPEAPPPGYVEKLFDEYARTFEQHLVEVLHYRAPGALYEAIVATTGVAGSAAWEVIDLGCGTGLCGPLLRPLAARLTGVDLSEAMLAQARAKAAYDELVQGDLIEVLGRHGARFDLAVAADVFIYLGNLAPVLAALQRALCAGGRAAFTTEAFPGPDFHLGPTGRYRHGRSYVEKMLREYGLALERIDAFAKRYEAGQPVEADLYVARRL